MKRIIIIASLLALTILGIQAQTVDEKSRELYDSGQFGAVIELLEKELNTQKEQNNESATLYYNLANAYYRTNEMGKARLYYERAMLLDPSDRDTKHNIDFVTTRIEDKIPAVDTFIFSMWFKSVQNLLKSNTWAVVSITTFLLLIVCFFIFFFTKITTVKKIVFYVGIVLSIVCLCGNIFAFNQKRNIEVRDTAVIMTAIAPVYSSPDRNSKEIFTLHTGTKIDITKHDRSWLEIELADGSVGWIERERIEII